MNSNIADLLKIGIPSILGIISSYVSYKLGRKGKIDDEKIKKCFEIGGKIGKSFQDICESHDNLYQFYQHNFAHLEFDKAIDAFGEHHYIYQEKYKGIQELHDEKVKLREELKSANLYLNRKIVKLIKEYLDISNFSYNHDGLGGIIYSDYYDNFWENLIDKSNTRKRNALKNKILKKINRLIP